MTDTLTQWAAAWRIPDAALTDLRVRLAALCLPAATQAAKGSEAGAQQAIRLEAAEKGILLWRNNSGALQDAEGRWVRYGLCNDSKQLNERYKSADLIGIRPVTVGAHHVGAVLGQFVAREIKAPGWRYSGTPREEAQERWLGLVSTMGGDAAFATGRGTL